MGKSLRCTWGGSGDRRSAAWSFARSVCATSRSRPTSVGRPSGSRTITGCTLCSICGSTPQIHTIQDPARRVESDHRGRALRLPGRCDPRGREGVLRVQLPEDKVDALRIEWKHCCGDAAWVEDRRQLDDRRVSVQREGRPLLDGLWNRHVSTTELKETFDLKTRTEWDVFGFKGLSVPCFSTSWSSIYPKPRVCPSV